jgi:hypothetical protein
VRGPATRGLVTLAALVGSVVLSVFATRADAAHLPGGPWAIVLDIAVGIAFLTGAALVPGVLRERALVALVGAAWLTGSFAPWALTLHQGLLLLTLLSFRSRARGGPWSWLGVVAAVAVAVQVVSQLGVAALFILTAGVRASKAPRGVTALYPVIASLGVAASLGLAWWGDRGAAPSRSRPACTTPAGCQP